MSSLTKKLLRNRDGNFAITTAFILPVLMMTVGLALDITEMSRTREALQQAVDAAALGAASSLATNGVSNADATQLAKSFLKGHMGQSNPLNLEDPLVDVQLATVSNHAKNYKVTVKSNYNVPLSGFQTLLGIDHARVSAVGVAESSTESKNPISMYLVLDRSGSMQWVTSTVDTSMSSCDNYYEANWPNPTRQSPCYIKKIESLKTAVSALAQVFETMDPDHELVRVGAVSYSTVANTPSALTWGTSTATTYVNALTATGGTNSTAAFQTAYNGLIASSENQAHTTKNGLVPSKFILFMTDGANDNTGNDTSTKVWCDTAKNAGIKVYSVAFSAPDRGKQLLSYCSSGAGYYFEATSVTQLIAAFQEIGKKTSKLENRLTQ